MPALFGSSDASLDAAQQQRNARRRSKMDEFESLLTTKETQRISLSSNLLSTPIKSNASSEMLDAVGEVDTPLATPQHSSSSSSPSTVTGSPTLAPRDPYNETQGSNKRRSVFRGVGTATSPDIATLVARAKADRARQSLSSVSDHTGDGESLPEEGEDLSTRPFSESLRESSTTADSFVVVAHPEGSADEPESKGVSESPPRPLRSPDRPTRSDFSTSTSPVEPASPPTPVYKERRQPRKQATDAALLQQSLEKSHILGSSTRSDHSSSTNQPNGSFTSTMRKTSGFFKKTFGTKPNSRETSKINSDRNRSLPPVPTVPANMVPERSASRNAAGRIKRASVDLNSNGLDPSAFDAPPLSVSGRTSSQDTRPRSRSFATEGRSFDEEPPTTAGSRRTTTTEDDRLRSAFDTVFPATSPAKDWDTAVATLGETPVTTVFGETTIPSTPTRRKQPADSSSPALNSAQADTILNMRPETAPDKIDTSSSKSNEGEARTPSIRLVPSPRSPLNPASPTDERKIRRKPPQEVNAEERQEIGLGFSTTDESRPTRHKVSHSMDTLPQHLFSPVLRTPEPSPSLRDKTVPTFLTSSPSPAPAGSTSNNDKERSRTPTRSSIRHSVVAYNGSPHSFRGAASDVMTTTEEDSALADKAKDAAERCWAEDESYLARQKVAEFLGSQGRLSCLALVEYMRHFDFKGLRLDNAFRKMCDKLYLKAESQQVDRILDAFAQQYTADNPDTLFGNADTVHAITYSLLLLNTDLHIADLTTRMSSKHFIRNTLFTLSTMPTNNLSGDVTTPSLSRARSSSIASHASEVYTTPQESPIRPRTATSNSLFGKSSSPEIENVLKEMYADIRLNPIYQPSAAASTLTLNNENRPPSSLNSGSPYSTWNASNGGRLNSRRSNVGDKRGSLRGFLGPSTDSLRPTSPSPSMSTGSDFFGHHSSGFTTPSSFNPNATFGFASNLSNTIKEGREEDEVSDSGASATDEELALLGAPWAKEGILHRKHYWEAPHRRSKDKTWLQAFVVISKGELKMFKFGDFSRGGGGAIGGGNWLNNAQSLGDMSLTHALCSAMPPPGYSSDRPHVFVLTLASGSSFFFQAGTQDLVQEWVSTCNYWAARLSKEPLLGGVSNIEYGWNRVMPVLDPHKSEQDDDLEDLASVKSGKSNRSHKSGRSSRSRFTSRGTIGFNSRSSNANDRVTVHDWKPPIAPLSHSTLSEEAQVEALRRHVLKLQAELEAHNELRSPMTLLFSARSVNASKSSSNWEKKSQYLLSEIVKYTTYIHSLRSAMKSRQSRSAEKTMSKLLEQADVSISSPEKFHLENSQNTSSPSQETPPGRVSTGTNHTDVFYDSPSRV